MTQKVAIIGSGSAGYTAGIYAGRAGLEPVLYEGFQPGGLLTTTNEVENYPGFHDGVNGFSLMQKMQQQAERFNTTIISDEVEHITINNDNVFTLSTILGDTSDYYSVILATGSTPKQLHIPGEQEYTGNGVSTCATCDGFFYKGKVVAVIGGGDAAVEEAIFLTRFATKVYLIHRRSEFRAQKILVDEVMHNPKIEIVFNTTVTAITGHNNTVNGIVLTNNEALKLDGVFVSIGHDPKSTLVKDLVDLDDIGYVVNVNTITSLPGLFVAGDVSDRLFRQAVTAASSGCQAAIMADKYLASCQ